MQNQGLANYHLLKHKLGFSAPFDYGFMILIVLIVICICLLTTLIIVISMLLPAATYDQPQQQKLAGVSCPHSSEKIGIWLTGHDAWKHTAVWGQAQQ